MSFNNETERKLSLTSMTWSLSSIIDSISTGVVYTCYIMPSLKLAYQNTLRFIFLPVYMLDSAIAAVCAWLSAYYERNQNGSWKSGKIFIAFMTTVASLCMLCAGIFGMLAQFSSGVLSPIFFALNMIINSGTNLFLATFKWGKSVAAPEAELLDHEKIVANGDIPDERDRKKLYRDQAIGHAIAGVLGCFVAVTAFIVVVLEKTILAPIGTVLGVVGVVLNGIALVKKAQDHFNIWKKKKAKVKVDEPEPVSEPTLSTNAQLHAALGVTQDMNCEDTTDNDFEQHLEELDFVVTKNDCGSSLRLRR